MVLQLLVFELKINKNQKLTNSLSEFLSHFIIILKNKKWIGGHIKIHIVFLYRLKQDFERLLLNYNAGILDSWRRRIQSGARDEAWSLRAFV